MGGGAPRRKAGGLEECQISHGEDTANPYGQGVHSGTVGQTVQEGGTINPAWGYEDRLTTEDRGGQTERKQVEN